MGSIPYEGGELALFARAENWKRYFRRCLAPHIRGRVLEVGAGLGGTTAVLGTLPVQSWTALEPDPALVEQFRVNPAIASLPVRPEIATGILSDLPAGETFDTVLYIDVLEHIDDDRAELARAVGRLSNQGRAIVLCPAHQFLYTPFDRAIGHFRRYDKAMFRALTPRGSRLTSLYYLDSVGMLLSLANRLFLKSAMPTPRQIAVWDRVFVRCSRIVDPLLFWSLGKTVVGVWAKDSRGA